MLILSSIIYITQIYLFESGFVEDLKTSKYNNKNIVLIPKDIFEKIKELEIVTYFIDKPNSFIYTNGPLIHSSILILQPKHLGNETKLPFILKEKNKEIHIRLNWYIRPNKETQFYYEYCYLYYFTKDKLWIKASKDRGSISNNPIDDYSQVQIKVTEFGYYGVACKSYHIVYKMLIFSLIISIIVIF